MIVDKPRIRYLAYAAITFVMLFGDTVQAQGGPSHNQFDIDFWFRAAMSGLLGTLIWIAKGSDIRLKAAEDKIKEFDKINVKRTERMEYNEKRLTSLEHEAKNHATSLGLLRELMLTKYHDKEDTEKHREHVEAILSQMNKRLERMESRMRMEQSRDDSRR